MSAQTYEPLSVELKINIKDYIDISSALIVDPKAIREKILATENKNLISEVAECIIFVGPRPDRILIKLSSRSSVPIEVSNKIKDKINKIESFIKKHNIRGTQFQAAFPDVLFKIRESILKQKGILQRFCSDDVLPIVFQFPGSGPILPDEYRNVDHYGNFNVELTKALSQGKLSVNWSIIEKSLEWKINLPEVENYNLLADHQEQSEPQNVPKKGEKKEKKQRT